MYLVLCKNFGFQISDYETYVGSVPTWDRGINVFENYRSIRMNVALPLGRAVSECLS